MIDKQLIIEMINEDYESKERNLHSYRQATDMNKKHLYWNAYLRDQVSFNARVQTLLALGYRVVCDGETAVDIELDD